MAEDRFYSQSQIHIKHKGLKELLSDFQAEGILPFLNTDGLELRKEIYNAIYEYMASNAPQTLTGKQYRFSIGHGFVTIESLSDGCNDIHRIPLLGFASIYGEFFKTLSET